MSNPRKIHWKVVKWILRYMKGTSYHVLKLIGEIAQLQGYVDLDMDHDLEYKRRSTMGYVFTLVGTTINWISRF